MRMPSKHLVDVSLVVDRNYFLSGVNLDSGNRYDKEVELIVTYGFLFFKTAPQKYLVPTRVYCWHHPRPFVSLLLHRANIPEWYNIAEHKLEYQLQKLFNINKIYIQCKDD